MFACGRGAEGVPGGALFFRLLGAVAHLAVLRVGLAAALARGHRILLYDTIYSVFALARHTLLGILERRSRKSKGHVAIATCPLLSLSGTGPVATYLTE